MFIFYNKGRLYTEKQLYTGKVQVKKLEVVRLEKGFYLYRYKK